MAGRVYIIDDDPGAVASASQALRSGGYSTAHFTDASAFARAGEASPGCILLDVGAERLGALRALRARGCDWPVVATSALADVRLAASSLQAGASDFIAKPLDADELVEIVRSAAALLD